MRPGGLSAAEGTARNWCYDVCPLGAQTISRFFRPRPSAGGRSKGSISRLSAGGAIQIEERHEPRPPAGLAGADVGGEVLAGEGGGGGDEVGGGALEDDPAAVVTGAGAEVDDPVGVRHDRLVVLDDDHRLA